VTSLLEWLEESGLTLRINGPEWDHGSRPIFLVSRDLLPAKDEYQTLYSTGISLPGELRGYRLTDADAGDAPVEELALRPGQLWVARGEAGLATEGCAHEILSFGAGDDDSGTVMISTLLWKGRSVRARELAAGDRIDTGGLNVVTWHRGAASSSLKKTCIC
jgi:hypothetical protein